jgi:hypothetical protein
MNVIAQILTNFLTVGQGFALILITLVIFASGALYAVSTGDERWAATGRGMFKKILIGGAAMLGAAQLANLLAQNVPK